MPEQNWSDPHAVARSAAKRLTEMTDIPAFDVAVVLGSGWRPAVDMLGDRDREFLATELPGFRPATATGHAGTVRVVRAGSRAVLAFVGRTHLYEGHGVEPVVHSVRTAVAAGCRIVVLTNASGAVRESFRVGQPVLIRDHINLMATSPIRGARFVDLTDLYSSRLRALCKEIDPSLDEGVYVAMPGPHYETPAEIRMLEAIGGDLVGMSTVLEAIAAREAGAEVLGVSLVTNLAAGLGEPLDHEDVLATGRRESVRMGRLLAEVVRCEHPDLPA
ncbi:MAG: purine-nucleoside phosphorylase [Streptosporangiales bacterium]|nr:purine-nucleoside phosphorylase [Streptosporangiales bacterium]MBO0891957.1 purine-nucleoside phosphorylase [Acidothermales bacterium]